MSTTLHRATVETVAGTLTVLVEDDGAVRASGYTTSTDELVALLPAALRAPGALEIRDDAPGGPTAAVVAAVEAYDAGDLRALDAVPVRQDPDPATPVARMRVSLRAVGPGETRSYAGLAADAGSPRGSRAAGQACARNSVAPFVPCHRVLPSAGGLGGYRWGVEVKRRLLSHEGAPTATPSHPRAPSPAATTPAAPR